jgi:hypothetical protein
VLNEQGMIVTFFINAMNISYEFIMVCILHIFDYEPAQWTVCADWLRKQHDKNRRETFSKV